MKRLLTFTAAIEAGTGIGLLLAPSKLAGVLLGVPLEGRATLTIAHIAGVALITISVACWLARGDEQSRVTRGIAGATVIYNLGATIILGAYGLYSRVVGIALWPAVILHAAMTCWCIAQSFRKPFETKHR